MRIEETILSNLVTSEDYCRKVLPFLQADYFSVRQESILFETINDFVTEYNALPTKEALSIEASNRKDISDEELKLLIDFVDGIKDKNTHKDWLVDETEKFCKTKSIYNAIMQSIKIIDGRDKKYKEDAIPKLLQDALAVSFDTSVGHDYFKDSSSRYDLYGSTEESIPYDLKIFNKVWRCGLPKKSLSVIVAQSGGGKSLLMSHIAAGAAKAGKNVLYITCEMSENKIAERIDANFLRVDIDKIINLGRDNFITEIDRIAEKSRGRLFIKEYPPSSASVTHFNTLLAELKTKQNFVPDLIVVDYLGIVASARMKMGSGVNTNSYLGSVAEELRGMAIEHNVPVLTGAQLNRGGFNHSEVDETHLADAISIFMTCDIMYAIMRSPEMDELDQVLIKQLKNRYGDPNNPKRFLIGINRARMTVYDLEDSAQEGLTQNETPTTRKDNNPSKAKTQTQKSGLDSLNF